MNARKLATNKTAIEKTQFAHNNRGVSDYSSLVSLGAANLRIVRLLQRSSVDPQIISEVVEIMKAAGPAQSKLPLLDDETQLPLPPAPRTPYQNRREKYCYNIDAEKFLQSEWGDYASHSLLSVKILKMLDNPLSNALYYKSRSSSGTAEDYLLSLGIFNRTTLSSPPPELARQADLLQRAEKLLDVWLREQQTNSLTTKIG